MSSSISDKEEFGCRSTHQSENNQYILHRIVVLKEDIYIFLFRFEIFLMCTHELKQILISAQNCIQTPQFFVYNIADDNHLFF